MCQQQHPVDESNIDEDIHEDYCQKMCWQRTSPFFVRTQVVVRVFQSDTIDVLLHVCCVGKRVERR